MFNRKLLTLVLGGCIGASVVQAESQGYVGALVGAQTFTKGGGTGLGFGANVGMMATADLGVGAYFTYRAKEGVKSMPFGLEVNYWLKDLAPGLYVGARVGMLRSSAEGLSSNRITFGAQAGYDYALAPEFTIGAELGYNFVMSKDGVDASAIISYLASVKYWF